MNESLGVEIEAQKAEIADREAQRDHARAVAEELWRVASCYAYTIQPRVYFADLPEPSDGWMVGDDVGSYSQDLAETQYKQASQNLKETHTSIASQLVVETQR
jgi:hypothetical protein